MSPTAVKKDRSVRNPAGKPVEIDPGVAVGGGEMAHEMAHTSSVAEYTAED